MVAWIKTVTMEVRSGSILHIFEGRASKYTNGFKVGHETKRGIKGDPLYVA